MVLGGRVFSYERGTPEPGATLQKYMLGERNIQGRPLRGHLLFFGSDGSQMDKVQGLLEIRDTHRP